MHEKTNRAKTAMRALARLAAICVFGTAAMTSRPSVAHAEPTAAEIVVARRLFSEAVELREAGKYADAEAKLNEAIAIKETPGLRFHLALCEEKLGHLVGAQVEYDRAAELIQQGAKAPDVEELVGPARTALKERIPTVTVRVPPAEREVRLDIDDRPVARALIGQAIPLDPGTHSLAVSATGRKRFTLQVTLAEGDDRAVDVALSPLGPSVDGPAPASASEASSATAALDATPSPRASGFGAREAVLIGEGAVFVAGAVVGTVGAINYGVANDDAQSASGQITGNNSPSPCGSPSQENKRPCADLTAAVNARQTDSWVMLGGFVGAGAGAVAAVVTWLVWPKHGVSDRAPSMSFVPMPGGASLFGTF